jgi:uncharacterized protein YkwD
VCRPVAALVAVASLVVLTTACFPDVSSQPPADAWDAQLFALVNRDRANAGVPQVANSPKLGNLAGSWSAQMASDGWVHHQDLGGLLVSNDFAGYSTLGETLLLASPGASPAEVEATWMASGAHRSVVLDPTFNLVGVGHVWGPDGRLWVTADFGRR